MALVRERSIPTERPSLVGARVNVLRIEGVAWSAQRIPTVYFFCFLDRERYSTQNTICKTDFEACVKYVFEHCSSVCMIIIKKMPSPINTLNFSDDYTLRFCNFFSLHYVSAVFKIPTCNTQNCALSKFQQEIPM
jgi:hypothetical protein